ncbi:hypothetical protein AB0K68_36095 [Streptomyces sp. NPDC050698]
MNTVIRDLDVKLLPRLTGIRDAAIRRHRKLGGTIGALAHAMDTPRSTTGDRAAYALACQAADQTYPPKRTELLSLAELRERWRTSAMRPFGACTVYRLAERGRAAAAAVWVRVRPVVDIVLAAVDVVAAVLLVRAPAPLLQVRPGSRVTPCAGLLPGRAPP